MMNILRSLLSLLAVCALSQVASAQLVSFGSQWKYLDDGTDQGTAWQAPAFDDSLWAAGNAQLGYGDGDETTVLSYGPNASNKYITYYFRHEFQVADAAAVTSLVANMLDDDGAVVYLNGQEVIRNNMPSGVIGYLTTAVSAVGSTENDIDSYTLNPSVLVTGTNVLAVEVHQSSATSSDLGFDFELDDTPQTGTQFIPPGSAWKYLDDGSDQGTAWQLLGFNDSLWGVGNAQLGYGDGDESTVISFGPNSLNKHITYYFRHEFQVTNPSAVPALTARLLDDDGAVVYLNGTEVIRNNLPSGNITYLTEALTAASSGENNFDEYFLDTNLLVAGTNVLAVEVHQVSGTSSDVSFDFELNDDVPPPVLRGPYLQMSGPDRMLVRWRTATAGPSQVDFGPAPGSLTSFVHDPTLTTEHSVLITGLTADTVYYYAFGDGNNVLGGDDSTTWFRTSPAQGTPRPSRFWLLGDCGTADFNQGAVRDAFTAFNGGNSTDLMILLGDNAYNSGTDQEYQNAIFNKYPGYLKTTPMWSTRGNHETQWSTYYGIFDNPTAGEIGGLASGTEAYYSFDFANVHLVCLDTQGNSLSGTGAMATWLAADLAATTQPWIIAYFHHPPYTKGSHDSDNNADSSGRMRDVRANILPILEAGGVDMVFAGHSHAYERSYLIDGHYGQSTTFNVSHKLDGGDGSRTGNGAYVKGTGPNQGTVYTVAGSSGKVSYSGSLNHPAMHTNLRQLGSVVFDVDDDYIDISFLNSAGQVADSYTLTHTDQPPTLSCTPLTAGQFGFLTVSQATPGATLLLGYSLTGAGPTPTAYGPADLSMPIGMLPGGTADALGMYTLVSVVPPQLSGMTVYLQALEITGPGTGLFSNGLAEAVQ